MTKQELKLLINEVINEVATNDFPADMERALKQAKKKGDHEQSAYYTQALKGGGSAYAGWDKFKGSWAYEQWLKKPETQNLIKAIKAEYDRFSYMREAETKQPDNQTLYIVKGTDQDGSEEWYAGGSTSQNRTAYGATVAFLDLDGANRAVKNLNSRGIRGEIYAAPISVFRKK